MHPLYVCLYHYFNLKYLPLLSYISTSLPVENEPYTRSNLSTTSSMQPFLISISCSIAKRISPFLELSWQFVDSSFMLLTLFWNYNYFFITLSLLQKFKLFEGCLISLLSRRWASITYFLKWVAIEISGLILAFYWKPLSKWKFLRKWKLPNLWSTNNAMQKYNETAIFK